MLVKTGTVARPPLSRPGLLRFSATQLLIALIILFVAMPFLEFFRQGPRIETLLTTVVLLSAVMAVGGERPKLLIGIALAMPSLATHWGYQLWPDRVGAEFVTICETVFVGFVVLQLLQFVLRARRVNAEVLCAGVSVYLLLGLLFASAHSFVALRHPGAYRHVPAEALNSPLTGFEALYFSFGTLTTVDYGDITPVSNIARMLSMVEATVGVFYITVLIARLAAHYLPNSPQNED